MADSSERYAEQLLEVANDAARAVGSRFVTFLTVGVYIAITVASTTDEMLVRGSLVTLPLLNAQIPIAGFFGFYTVAPWLLLVLHCDILLQMSTLSRKLALFRAASEGIDPQQRSRLRERLANFYYVQFLTGDGPSRVLHELSGLILWLAVIAFPLAVMLATEVRFLPYHNPTITWLHRLAIIADVGLIAVTWPRLSPRIQKRGPASGRSAWRSFPPLVALVCGAALVVGLGVATIPGERPGDGTWFKVRNLRLEGQVLTANPLPPEVVNMLRDGTPEQREKQLLLVSPLKSLQGRDLRHADFFNAVLPRLDLRALRDDENRIRITDLRGADLRWSQMQGVLLNEANLENAEIEGAQLQGASLENTLLGGANLRSAQLQNAKLVRARLSTVRAAGARFQGADLTDAVLDGADLSAGEFQGAILRNANLQNANLSGAGLQGADLSGAKLEGAKLRGANLRGAILRNTTLAGADFEGAELDLTTIELKDGTTAGDARQLGELFAKAHIGRCSEPQSFLPRCAARQNPSSYEQSMVESLRELACSSGYVARGLAVRMNNAEDPTRIALAKALSPATIEAPCEGLKLLAPDVQQRAIEIVSAQTGPNLKP